MKHFEKSVQLNPNDQVAVGNLADGYRWAGEKEKARSTYERAIALAYQALQVNPRDASTLGSLAAYYAKTGDSKRGLDFIQRARSIDSNDTELLYQEAIVNTIAGQQTDALKALRQAFQNGYPVAQAKNDPELKPLEMNVEFGNLLAEFNSKKG